MEKQQTLIKTWQEHLQKQEDSKLSIAGYCRANSLQEHRFHYWKRRLRSRMASGFIELPKLPAPEEGNLFEIKIDQNLELQINLKIPGSMLRDIFR